MKKRRIFSLAENPKKNSKKNGSKRAKMSVFWPKIAVFLADFFLSGIGGYPPPLNGKSPKKILKKMGQKGLNLAFLGQK